MTDWLGLLARLWINVALSQLVSLIDMKLVVLNASAELRVGGEIGHQNLLVTNQLRLVRLHLQMIRVPALL
jgi:hypothetical protein